jgi:hypothetical protein
MEAMVAAKQRLDDQARGGNDGDGGGATTPRHLVPPSLLPTLAKARGGQEDLHLLP